MAKQVTKYESNGSTAAAALYDEGTVQDGAATTARRIWWKNTSTAAEALAGCRFRRVASAGNDGIDMLQIAPDVPLAAPGAATAAAAAGAGLGLGHYHYAVTFVTANGETTAGTLAEVDTTEGNQQVALSAIPTGPAGTTARKLYRTVVGGTGDLKLVATLANNTDTTYTDSTGDGSLGAAAPTLNTSGSAGTWGTANVVIGELAVGAYAACWMRYNVPADTSEVGNDRLAYVQFEET